MAQGAYSCVWASASSAWLARGTQHTLMYFHSRVPLPGDIALLSFTNIPYLVPSMRQTQLVLIVAPPKVGEVKDIPTEDGEKLCGWDWLVDNYEMYIKVTEPPGKLCSKK